MSERIDIHIHADNDRLSAVFYDEILKRFDVVTSFSTNVHRKLDRIITQLEALKAQETASMATVTSVHQLVTDINNETNTVSDRIDAQTAKIAELVAKVAEGGVVTQEELDGIANALTPLSARMRALGANPEEPIPPPEEPPVFA